MGLKIDGDPPARVMLLASVAVSALVFVTWAVVRISRWIVSHDEVWAKMDNEGKRTEHELAEFFNAVGRSGLLVGTEVVCGLVFLWLLWRAFRPKGSPGS